MNDEAKKHEICAKSRDDLKRIRVYELGGRNQRKAKKSKRNERFAKVRGRKIRNEIGIL